MGQSYYSTKVNCFLEVLMTTMYLKEKRVSCIRMNSVVFLSSMRNITKIDWNTLCKSENVVNTPSEISLFVFRRLFKNTSTLLEKKIQRFWSIYETFRVQFLGNLLMPVTKHMPYGRLSALIVFQPSPDASTLYYDILHLVGQQWWPIHYSIDHDF